MSDPTRAILDNYKAENPGVLAKLHALLHHGRLGGTGKIMILPVDQGFEHGPARSFQPNAAGYDPHYHWELAIDSGLSAFAAPLGLLQAGAAHYAGKIPTILKVNNANSHSTVVDQAITGSVQDALRLGCVGIGYTLYPGAELQFEMMEELRKLSEEARTAGLIVVVWSYARGGALSKSGETALDVIAYAAHMAALMNAHIIKVKPPTAHIEQPEAKPHYEHKDWSKLEDRISHVVQSAFNGRRMVIFSGGAAKSDAELKSEIRSIASGGGFGSIIGRNAFQRPKNEAMKLLNELMDIYANRPYIMAA
ncbi:MAG: class I fructose-bisphosphate aldolase [Alphaproteobacteria bacterium]